MPIPNRKIPKASVNQRWLSAKSTTARITFISPRSSFAHGRPRLVIAAGTAFL
jgi:hypothetical protein